MANLFELSLMGRDTAYQDIANAVAPPGWAVVLKSDNPGFLNTAVEQGPDGSPTKTAGDFVDGGHYQGFLLHNSETGEWALVSRGTELTKVGNLGADVGIALQTIGISTKTDNESN